MKLPNDEIGVSDILQWRDCPRRMSFGMERHGITGQHPEAESPNTAYGTTFHDAVEHLERSGCTVESAIDLAFVKHGKWLEPADIPLLRQHLETYLRRDYLGVRTVASEGEFRVPLFIHEGTQIYFRFRIDRLYERLDVPGSFISVDYKSSKWPKTDEEVHSDVQQWAYNWGVHEVFPECIDLLQAYDQLRFGVALTRKSDSQRAMIKDWLIKQAKAVIADESYDDDGFLQPLKNDWCAYCQIMESCKIVPRMTHYALAEIAALAPVVVDGRKTTMNLDPSMMDEYVAQLAEVSDARKILERFETTVRDALLKMPHSRREAYGYDLRERKGDYWTPDTLRMAHEVLGDRFYEAIGISKAAAERVSDERVALLINALGESRIQSVFIQKRRAKKT